MDKGEMLYCENCHASIPADSVKCPYCGALNAPGGEKKYMERLYELREDVEELQSVPVKAYREEMGRTGRIIKWTLLFFIFVTVFAGAIFLWMRKTSDYEMSETDVKEQMLWEKENYPKLDAMYAEGNYDGILEFEETYCGENNYSIGNWEHADFIEIYGWYLSCKESASRIASGDYDKNDVYWCIMDAMFVIREMSYVNYSEEELPLIEEYRKEVRELLCTQFDMQEEDIDRLYEDSCMEDTYGTYFSYKLAEKNINQFVKGYMK